MEKLDDLGLTELQLEIKHTCRELGEKKILPVREKYDAEGIFPNDIAKDFAEAGLFGLFIPEEFGGMGGGTMDMVVAVEELSKYCAGIALSLFGTALGTLPILLCGSEEQKRKYLPRIAEGTIAAFALTEANAGSDAAGVRSADRLTADCVLDAPAGHRITVNGIDCPTFSQWIWKCTSVYQNIRPSVLCRRAINGFEHFLCCFSHCLSPPDAVPCALPHGRHRSFPCSLSRPLVPRARAPRTVRSAPTGTSRENDSNSRLTFLDVKL